LRVAETWFRISVANRSLANRSRARNGRRSASSAVAGVGFLGGAAVLALDVDVPRRPLYALGALWTLGQIVAWYVINAGSFSTLGYVDKAIQVALIAVLAVLIQREG